MKENTVLLFTAKTSSSFHMSLKEFEKLIKKFETTKSFTFKIIDITEKPKLAEQYKIEAIPTLIFGKLRLIGKPDAEKIAKIIQEAKEDQEFLKNYRSD
jgi:protein-disulfide isomerase